MNLVYIAAGGSAGAIARYLVSEAVNLNFRQSLPFATLLVNSTGSFFIGFLFILFEKFKVPNELKLLCITGFLGAYTTFSTYSLDTMRLLLAGRVLGAFLNFALSNGVCLLFVFAGIQAARLVAR